MLDPNAGERALLLKDYYGDWGILIGKWEGFRKGKPGTPGKLNVASTSIASVSFSLLQLIAKVNTHPKISVYRMRIIECDLMTCLAC